MRSSLRNPADSSPKTVVVMDAATAHWLADLFPGATVAPLGSEGLAPQKGRAGRPRVHKSNAARQAAHRRSRELELLIEQDVITGQDVVAGDYPDITKAVAAQMSEVGFCNEMSFNRGDFVTKTGSVFSSIYDTEPLHVSCEDDDSFIELLRELHGRSIGQKEAAGLISPACFDPDLAEDTRRGLANIRLLRGVWLDNDGGDLAHEEFARLFPRLRIVAWNTYSSTLEKPRWRAFIPTTMAMSKRVHENILAQILRTLNEEGYWSKEQLAENLRIKRRRTHGFDLSKLNAASVFYLPAQARDPAASFFIDYGADDARRGPIEPHVWIKRSIIHDKPEPEAPSAPPPAAQFTWLPEPVSGGAKKLQEIRANLQQQAAAEQRDSMRISRAIADWRSAAPGDGHRAFFALASRLRAAGLNLVELEGLLKSEVAFARSPRERRGEIKGIVRKLRS
jgi:hypothetical protein